MKKAAWIITLLLMLCVLFLLISGIFLLNRYYAEGVNSLGRRTHFSVFESAYVLNGDGKKANLTIDGTFRAKDDGTSVGRFHGYIQAEGFPIPYEGTTAILSNDGEGIPGVRIGDYIQIDSYLSVGINTDGSSAYSEYSYRFIFHEDHPEQIILIVFQNGQSVQTYVVADSYDQAQSIFQDYLDNRT